MSEICPKCTRPMNMGNSPNEFECHETDDDEGLCAAYAKIARLEPVHEVARKISDWWAGVAVGSSHNGGEEFALKCELQAVLAAAERK